MARNVNSVNKSCCTNSEIWIRETLTAACTVARWFGCSWMLAESIQITTKYWLQLKKVSSWRVDRVMMLSLESYGQFRFVSKRRSFGKKPSVICTEWNYSMLLIRSLLNQFSLIVELHCRLQVGCSAQKHLCLWIGLKIVESSESVLLQGYISIWISSSTILSFTVVQESNHHQQTASRHRPVRHSTTYSQQYSIHGQNLLNILSRSTNRLQHRDKKSICPQFKSISHSTLVNFTLALKFNCYDKVNSMNGNAGVLR